MRIQVITAVVARFVADQMDRANTVAGVIAHAFSHRPSQTYLGMPLAGGKPTCSDGLMRCLESWSRERPALAFAPITSG